LKVARWLSSLLADIWTHPPFLAKSDLDLEVLKRRISWRLNKKHWQDRRQT